jgi:methyl-accepting chemotaxis protein
LFLYQEGIDVNGSTMGAAGAADRILRESAERGDRLFAGALFALAFGSLCLAPWYGTWGAALIVGIPAAVVPLVVTRLVPGSLLGRCTVAAAFMVMAGLYIHQANGMIEFHFPIFALLAVLLYYRDWRPIVLAAGVIAVHHYLFAWMQMQGMSVMAFERGASFELATIHAAFVIAEVVMLTIFSVDMDKGARRVAEVEAFTQHLLADPDHINLELPAWSPDTELGRRLFDFVGALRDLIARFRESAHSLLDSGGSLVSLSDGVASKATENQNASSMVSRNIESLSGQLAGAVEDTEELAGYASRTSELSREGLGKCERSSAVIRSLDERLSQANETIRRLADADKAIGSVIDVIRGIAEQTNLLALNAAIEAARAGEQGRGFSVVADEVRTLAHRTQESTDEIQGMIRNLRESTQASVECMESSRRLATESVEEIAHVERNFGDIVADIGKLEDRNRTVADTVRAQAQVGGELSAQVHTLAEVAASNRDAAEQTRKISKELLELASGFERFGERFRLG